MVNLMNVGNIVTGRTVSYFFLSCLLSYPDFYPPVLTFTLRSCVVKVGILSPERTVEQNKTFLLFALVLSQEMERCRHHREPFLLVIAKCSNHSWKFLIFWISRLDRGGGKDLALPECPREQLEREVRGKFDRAYRSSN